MATVTQVRTFGIGDSVEQGLNIRIMQTLTSARNHLEEFKRTRRPSDFFRYWWATQTANRMMMRYERTYGSFTPDIPAPFVE